ncbi:MAG: hypothetical protein ACKVS5_08170 [Parvularculaceae bacterium]
MILRRITEHVRAQNWFAVALDFVIVVAGVFVGLQVNNWNEAQSSSRQEGVLIAQLADDLRSMRDSFVFSDTIAQRTHDGWVAIFRALEACRPLEADPALVQYALARYQRTSQVNVQRTAYDEMTSLGVFSRLSDKELKNDVARLYALIESDDLSALGGRTDQLAAGRIMWKSIAFSFASDSIESVDRDAGEFDSWVRAVFDPLDHCENLELRGAVWEMVDLNRDWLVRSATTVEEIDSVLMRLPSPQSAGGGAR